MAENNRMVSPEELVVILSKLEPEDIRKITSCVNSLKAERDELRREVERLRKIQSDMSGATCQRLIYEAYEKIDALAQQNLVMREALVGLSEFFQGKQGFYREEDMKNNPEFFKANLEQQASDILSLCPIVPATRKIQALEECANVLRTYFQADFGRLWKWPQSAKESFEKHTSEALAQLDAVEDES